MRYSLFLAIYAVIGVLAYPCDVRAISMVDVPEPTDVPTITEESEAVTVSDLSASLHSDASMPQSIAFTGDLVLHGAHGHPLANLSSVGDSLAWVKGDLGFHAEDASGSYSHVAEIGIGHRINESVQVNLSVGKIFAGQDTAFNGEYDQDMTYVVPELIANIEDTPIWATFSLKYAQGDVDVSRGYETSGSQDFSHGNFDAKLYGARVRVDWREAYGWEGFKFSPYIDQQHLATVLSSYTEAGGGFPARWDRRREDDDMTRLGIDIEKPIGNDINLHATLEQTYWWQGKGSGASGRVLGLSSFNIGSEGEIHNWSRFALGISKRLEGNGQVSAIANVSTSGLNPQYWLALGYKIDF